jgi:hypothetical protein
MAAIPVLDRNASSQESLTALDLTGGPHTFTNDTGNKYLVVTTDEAAGITLDITGDGVTNVECPGLGLVDVSTLPDFTVAVGETSHIYLNAIAQRFGANNNTVNVTVTGITTGTSTAYIVKD